MKRPPLDELARRCQKPDYQLVGNWIARKISRPAALRITWVVAPWGVTANTATLAAWTCGVAAAAVLGWGTIFGWVLGAVLLQFWYLLDHVDGQLARLSHSASLDGVQLDYLMHHTINLLVPLGVGWGIFAQTAQPVWALAGLLWGVSSLLITLQHDARYKAFVKRLKRVRGRLLVCGGAGGRPLPQPPIPRHPLRLMAWVARKSCEMHVVINLIVVIALVQWTAGDTQLVAGGIYLAFMAATAAGVAAWAIFRSQNSAAAENEFAAWYRVPRGHELICSDGWWIIEYAESGETGQGDTEESS